MPMRANVLMVDHSSINNLLLQGEEKMLTSKHAKEVGVEVDVFDAMLLCRC
jgi:hypothetical protein